MHRARQTLRSSCLRRRPRPSWTSNSKTTTSNGRVRRFKELADRKGEISEEGIRAIVTEKTSVATDVIELVGIHVLRWQPGGAGCSGYRAPQRRHRSRSTPKATAWSTPRLVHCSDVFDIPCDPARLSSQSAHLGSRRHGRSQRHHPGRTSETYSGRGVSTDVVEGSARAFTAALNKAAVDTDRHCSTTKELDSS